MAKLPITTAMRRNMNTLSIRALSLLILLCIASPLFPTTNALEATFTPNPADSLENGGTGGSLPNSLAQRKQLLQLESAIVNSQDPSATLNHVAQQNDMSQEELMGMLERNRNDLQESGQLESVMGEVNAEMQAQMQQQGGGGGGGGGMAASLPRRIVSLVLSLFMALFKAASTQVARNPKHSTLLVMMVVVSLLAVHNAPRNGIVISKGGVFPPFSRGHTTILEPPIDYLEGHCVKSWERGDGCWTSSLPEPIASSNKSSKSKKKSEVAVGGVGMTRSLEIDTLNAEEGEVTVETSRNDDGYALVVTAQTLIHMDPDDSSSNDEDDDDASIEYAEEALECMHESIRAIIDERKFSEAGTATAQILKFRSFLVASEDDMEDVMEGAVMAMKSLGDFGRYGVQPLCISYEMEDDDEDENEPMTHCVAFHTLAGGHFDGEIRFLVEERKSKKKKSKKSRSTSSTSEGVVISVTLAIPKNGRAPPKRLAESMVAQLAQSIATTSQIRTKQTLSRRRQSRSYRARATGRASMKRHLRFEQEKAQEAMAEDRKRKWKRNNPDAGHYRPSGHRLRSPHNCGLT